MQPALDVEVMLDWNQFATEHSILMAGCVAVAGLLLMTAVRRMQRGDGLLRLLAALSGIGERVRIYELSRLYLTPGMLSEGGITIVQAMVSIWPSPVVTDTFAGRILDFQTALGCRHHGAAGCLVIRNEIRIFERFVVYHRFIDTGRPIVRIWTPPRLQTFRL